MFDTFGFLKPENLTGAFERFTTAPANWITRNIFASEEDALFDTVSWEEIIGGRDIAKFNVGADSPANQRARMGVKTRYAGLLTIFEKVKLPESYLNLLRYPGTQNEKRVQKKISDELAEGRRRVDRTVEYVCASLLNGSLAIDQSSNLELASQIVQTLQVTVGTLSAGAAWSTTSTLIVSSEFSAIHDYFTQNVEMEVGYALHNRSVTNMLLKNDDVRFFFGSDKSKDELRRNARIRDIDGIQFNQYDAGYVPAGGSYTKYLTDDYLLFLPEDLGSVGKMYIGEKLVPNDIVGEATSVIGGAGAMLRAARGYFSYAVVTTDPVAVWIYYGKKFLPAVTWPATVLKYNSTP